MASQKRKLSDGSLNHFFTTKKFRGSDSSHDDSGILEDSQHEPISCSVEPGAEPAAASSEIDHFPNDPANYQGGKSKFWGLVNLWTSTFQ